MIVSLSLSRQTDITYHCSVSCLCCRAKYLTLCGDHSLQHTHIYYTGARLSPILLAKSPRIHIKRVHMAGNAAKRKMRNLKLEKDPEYCKKREMYSARSEVNWTPVQAEESWILIPPFLSLCCMFSCWRSLKESVYLCSLPLPPPRYFGSSSMSGLL